MDERARLLAFLSRFIRGHELKDDDDIFAMGFVNSLFAMQLVSFLEGEFGITVEDDDLDINNFRSVSAMLRLLAKKREAAPA
jgi:acyl carrier protein